MARIHELEVEDYLADCVVIEPTALEEEFVRLPADLAYWNARLAGAHRRMLETKLGLERISSRLHLECREKLLADAASKSGEAKIKAPTVSDIEAAVSACPEMHAAQDAALTAEAEKVYIAGVVDAVRTKRDMIISLGAHIRAEMQGDPTLREQSLTMRRAREEG